MSPTQTNETKNKWYFSYEYQWGCMWLKSFTDILAIVLSKFMNSLKFRMITYFNNQIISFLIIWLNETLDPRTSTQCYMKVLHYQNYFYWIKLYNSPTLLHPITDTITIWQKYLSRNTYGWYRSVKKSLAVVQFWPIFSLEYRPKS